MRHLCWPNLTLHMMDRSLKRGYIKHISNRKWILFCPIKKTQFDPIRGAARIPGLIIQVLMMLKSHLSLSQLAINMTKMKITKIWIEILKVFKITEEQFHQEICKRIAFNYYQTKIKNICSNTWKIKPFKYHKYPYNQRKERTYLFRYGDLKINCHFKFCSVQLRTAKRHKVECHQQ